MLFGFSSSGVVFLWIVRGFCLLSEEFEIGVSMGLVTTGMSVFTSVKPISEVLGASL